MIKYETASANNRKHSIKINTLIYISLFFNTYICLILLWIIIEY